MSLIDSDFLLQLNPYRFEANRCKEPKSDASLQYKKGSWERYIGGRGMRLTILHCILSLNLSGHDFQGRYFSIGIGIDVLRTVLLW
jgi:hypothetical protein